MSVIVILILGIVLYPYLSDMFFSKDLDIQYRASQAFLLLLSRLMPVVVIIFILVVLHQILITHRIWGPLVNITNTIKRVGIGDFTRKVFPRKNDYLSEQCRQINEMIEGLSSHISTIRENHVKLTSSLNDISESIENLNTQNEFEECLNKIRGKVELLTENLSCFKLEDDSQQ
jgi:methyl-accepting chemotaxis protein